MDVDNLFKYLSSTQDLPWQIVILEFSAATIGSTPAFASPLKIWVASGAVNYYLVLQNNCFLSLIALNWIVNTSSSIGTYYSTSLNF